MGLLNIDEHSFQVGLENLVERFNLILEIEPSPTVRIMSFEEQFAHSERENQAIEALENKAKEAIRSIPHNNPKPREIRDIFRKILGIDPKIKKTSQKTPTGTYVEYRVKNDIMNQPGIWSSFYVRIPLPSGFLLTNFNLTFFRND